MGLSPLRAMAGRAPVPVFVVCGLGGREVAEAARLMPGVEVVDSPRSAAVLLVVGELTEALVAPIQRLHDQLPTPRASLWWRPGTGGVDLEAMVPGLVVGEPGDGPGLRRLFTDLIGGRRGSSPPALPDVETNPWRGIGPYGQGGAGMTGGVPYGHPLPGWAEDRDGLKLDQLAFRVGPAFPPLPAGLILDVQVQGDVVQHATVGPNPFSTGPDEAVRPAVRPAIFATALRQPVRVADLELARARHHLSWAAGALRLHGLVALGARVHRTAADLGAQNTTDVAQIVRDLLRRRSLRAALSGVGAMRDVAPPGLVARAAGATGDARTADPAYTGLGFEPLIGSGGDDAWGRFRQRLGEAQQAVHLAATAGDRLREPGGPLEGPRGPLSTGVAAPSVALLAALPAVLEGLEWGDAMATVVSLDIDLEEAAQAEALEPTG